MHMSVQGVCQPHGDSQSCAPRSRPKQTCVLSKPRVPPSKHTTAPGSYASTQRYVHMRSACITYSWHRVSSPRFQHSGQQIAGWRSSTSMSWFAVARGHQCRVFDSAQATISATAGFPNAYFRQFHTKAEAEAFLAGYQAALQHMQSTGVESLAHASQGHGDATLEVTAGSSASSDQRRASAEAAPPAPACTRASTAEDTPARFTATPDPACGSARAAATQPATAGFTHFKAHFDGASRGNPGVGGAGALLYGAHTRDASSWNLICQQTRPLHQITNNQAEWHGCLLALKLLQDAVDRSHAPVQSISLRGDSQLVLRQLSGQYQVKHPGLQPLARQGKGAWAALTSKLPAGRCEILHVPRAQNAAADDLANHATDAATAKPARG